MSEPITNLYMQLFGVGLLWVTIHCGGMCGPIMAGLVTHTSSFRKDATPKEILMERIKGVLSYQSGRAVTYAILGGLAGGFGAMLATALRQVTQVTSFLAAALMLLMGMGTWMHQHQRKERTPQSRTSSASMIFGKKLGAFARYISLGHKSGHKQRMFLWGIIMGFLPCMLMFWALSLSIASASVLHGAMLMMILVAMTTPVLTLAACSTVLGQRRHKRWQRLGTTLVPFALIASGVWMMLISLASNDIIAHIHIPFRMFGEFYTFMLW